MEPHGFNFTVSLLEPDLIKIVFNNDIPIIDNNVNFIKILNYSKSILSFIYNGDISICTKDTLSGDNSVSLHYSLTNIDELKNCFINSVSFKTTLSGVECNFHLKDCIFEQSIIEDILLKTLLISLIFTKLNNSKISSISIITSDRIVSDTFTKLVTYGFDSYIANRLLININDTSHIENIEDISEKDFIIKKVCDTC